MVDPKPPGGGPLRLELTVPCDARYGRLLEAMCEKLAVYVGYAQREARAVAETMTQATAGGFGAGQPHAYQHLNICFATTEREMEIRVRYLCSDQACPGHPDIEGVLGRGESDAAPLEVMRRVMQRVEFRRDGGIECCTLAKRLPGRASRPALQPSQE